MTFKTAGAGIAGVLVVGVAIASIWMHPLAPTGLIRVVENIGTESCIVERSIQACEKMILHEPSGYLYMSCSDPVSRTKWTPAVDIRVQPKTPPEMDHFLIVDTSLPLSPASYKKIKISNLPTTDPKWRGLNFVGLDVVASDTDPSLLWVYVINHRPPVAPATPETYGADSCVEIFTTRVGSDTFEYARTVEDPQHIITPNDVVGKSDGSGFWVSNDHSVRVGLLRLVSTYFHLEGAGITYCSVQTGCKFAITGLPDINGIARDVRTLKGGMRKQDIFYAAGYALVGKLYVMERQEDDSLVLVDTTAMGYSLDNVQVAKDGSVYIAAISKPLDWVTGYMDDPQTFITPSAVLKVSVNPMSFYGDKYKVIKIFENNGTIISGATTAVWDENRGLLWVHGLASMGLVSCKL